jgi:hypothetical protein
MVAKDQKLHNSIQELLFRYIWTYLYLFVESFPGFLYWKVPSYGSHKALGNKLSNQLVLLSQGVPSRVTDGRQHAALTLAIQSL